MSRAKRPDWLALRLALHERSGGACEACGRLRGELGVVHHRQLRSQGGRHELTNLVVLHDGCHRFVHENPSWSKAHGLIVSGWSAPDLVPVVRCMPSLGCEHWSGTTSRE